MKQPKTFLFLSIVVAVLVLGVAYAAITQVNLTVSGDVVADGSQENFKVAFTGNGSKSADSAGEGTLNLVAEDANKLSATLNITGLTTKGQTSTWTIKIGNESAGELAAALECTTLTPEVSDGTQHKDTTNNASAYFSVQASLDTDEIAVGEEATLTITVTVNKTPIDTVNGIFTVLVTANPVN